VLFRGIWQVYVYTSQMEFSEISTILEEWQSRTDDIDNFKNERSPYHNNGLRVLTLFRTLAAFLQEKEPLLRSWMMSYLNNKRVYIFGLWWNRHFTKWAVNQVEDTHPEKESLHPAIEDQWNTILGTDHEDKVSVAKRMVEYYHTRQDVKDCDDITIKAIHEGRNCISNGWFCDYCETQELLWKSERVRRIKTCHHPLLNEEQCGYLACYHKEKHPELCSWEPLHVWSRTFLSSRTTKYIYDWNEYKDYLQTSRERCYTKTGQTPRQAIEDFLWETEYHTGILNISYSTKWHKEFDVFCKLWNRLDTISVSLEYDLKRVEEIQAMF
jgi:hypothetical protein